MDTLLIFEKSKANTSNFVLPVCTLQYPLDIPQLRQQELLLPEVAEVEVVRHYTKLSKKAYGVDDGFYPLGSCTMKYNPKIADSIISATGFTDIHPLQPENTTKGCQKIIEKLRDNLCAITGMDNFTLTPAAGAHGEFLGLLLVRKYHQTNKDDKRNVVLVPDSAHGTNPASANMCDYQIKNIPSNINGTIDIEALKLAVDDTTACLMLTNPNTLGLFEKDIAQIAEIVHKAGGLLYYDGANLNAIMGITTPRKMGFDIVHLNLHKTFGTPHGAGGPGSGPLGCVAKLHDFLPESTKDSVGIIKAFYGNFLVLVRALIYIKMLGREGLLKASKNAVLNANYLMHKLSDSFVIPYIDQGCMHEFVISMEKVKEEKAISAFDIAKGLIDFGIHPPTMYFPLIVKEALMVEPTETESKETLDDFVKFMEELLNDPKIHDHPYKTPVTRIDEVQAARKPILIYTKK